MSKHPSYFLSIDYNLSFPAETSDLNRHLLTAAQAINDLTGLGHIVSALSANKIFASDEFAVQGVEQRCAAMDAGTYVLGQTIAAISDVAYSALRAAHELIAPGEDFGSINTKSGDAPAEN